LRFGGGRDDEKGRGGEGKNYITSLYNSSHVIKKKFHEEKEEKKINARTEHKRLRTKVLFVIQFHSVNSVDFLL